MASSPKEVQCPSSSFAAHPSERHSSARIFISPHAAASALYARLSSAFSTHHHKSSSSSSKSGDEKQQDFLCDAEGGSSNPLPHPSSTSVIAGDFLHHQEPISSNRKTRRRSSSTSSGRKKNSLTPAITTQDDKPELNLPSPTNSAVSASVPPSPSLLTARVRMLSPRMQRSIRINENQVSQLYKN